MHADRFASCTIDNISDTTYLVQYINIIMKHLYIWDFSVFTDTVEPRLTTTPEQRSSMI